MTAEAVQALAPTDNKHPPSPIESDKQEELTSPYLTVPQAAAYMRVSKNYLDKLRVSGTGPPFVRLGRRKILYRKADLNHWVEGRIFGSTTEYGS